MACSSCNSAQQIWPYGADMVVPEPAHFDGDTTDTAPAVEEAPATPEPAPEPVAEPEATTES
nr:MAG TPA: hypothetical protein [Caudoviricetes sp.]